MTADELAGAFEDVSEVISNFAIIAVEAFDNLVTGLRPYFEYLEQNYPEAFDENGKLRDDWLTIVYGKQS